MADGSDSDENPRRDTILSKTIMKGDGSARRAEIPTIYRLESSDGPGNVLIACNLNGDNYLTWSRAWLFNTMEKDLQSTVAYAMDAKELWDDLKEQYSEGNQTQIYQIKFEIYILKRDGKRVREYYSKLKLLWDELEFYLEKPSCCCGANNKFVAQRETEKIFQFLMGLTSEYNTVQSNILSIELMPSLNKVYQMIVHEERQKLVARSHDSTPEAAVFFVKGGGGPNNVGKQQQQPSEARPVCEHCGKLGHTNKNLLGLEWLPSMVHGRMGQRKEAHWTG
ncbi:uncharacterized protein LOC125316437 [Rhodamnia argentea]|uniref:Uncharacterized protein LOC125316437 n=1 Tax=Rhodamnia argentea TaxID=178133 RepID=A0ABM3HVT6_9MYRT|nr:uncharacterized protein LOC125316437 [Rhodamnia argentea]